MYEDLISSVQCVFMLLPINLQIGRLDILVFLLGGPCGWPPLDKRMHLKLCPYFACCKSYSIILPLKATLVLVSRAGQYIGIYRTGAMLTSDFGSAISNLLETACMH